MNTGYTPHSNASPSRPYPAPPVTHSVALAVAVPVVALLALQPELTPSAAALALGYVSGRRTD